MAKTAIRRHHTERLKKARVNYWGHWNRWYDSPWTPKSRGAVTRTPCPCSCYTCGNPRRWMKGKDQSEGTLTYQERKLFQDLD